MWSFKIIVANVLRYKNFPIVGDSLSSYTKVKAGVIAQEIPD
jgi:hypothetical protein